jgi:polar amino acid transport system substrate-binding protein
LADPRIRGVTYTGRRSGSLRVWIIPAMISPVRSRRLVLQGLVAAPLAGLAACMNMKEAARPTVSEAAATAFAPTGKLRASINLGNPILANKGPDGTAVGVSVDLSEALGELLGVPLEYRVVEAAARSVEAVKTGQADIGFFAIDPLRGDGIRFSAAYVQIEGGYLVKQDSLLTDNAQVDRAGTRIMVGKGSA